MNTQENILYNNILLLSRNKLFYTKFNLTDSFQNRIMLIFIHMSFLFIKIKKNKKTHIYKTFYQKLFDFTFKKIEENMREIGYGDVSVNKNMKFLVKNFYNILLNCEDFDLRDGVAKKSFFNKYLKQNNTKNNENSDGLVLYFDKYYSFCLDLSSDSVLKGVLNFKFK